MLSETALRKIMPRCPSYAMWADELSRCLDLANATNPLRISALLAQIAHESGECRYLRELGDGRAYEGRVDLGNIYPGDGERFKGHGLIHLTGRKNHRLAGLAIGLDLELHPELAEVPSVASSVAAWYWVTHRCNPLADNGDFVGVTRAINGGTNGLARREKYYHRALKVLGGKNG